MDEHLLYHPIYHDTDQPGYERSDRVRKWVNDFLIPSDRATLDESLCNAYLVATGDSGIMHVARTKFQQDKLIFGVNCGSVGFLLNDVNDINQIPLKKSDLRIERLRLIKGTFLTEDRQVSYLAFNEICISGQGMDFVHFTITGSSRDFQNRQVSGMSIFVSTPQGSTGLALRAKGSLARLPLKSNCWFIGGGITGPYPADQVLPQKITIEAKSRFNVSGYADGHSQIVESVKAVIVEPTDYYVDFGFIGDFESKRTRLAQKLERGEI